MPWLYSQAVFGKSLVKHFSGSGLFSQYKTLNWSQMAQLAVKLWLVNLKVIDGSFAFFFFFENSSPFPNAYARWNGQMHPKTWQIWETFHSVYELCIEKQ